MMEISTELYQNEILLIKISPHCKYRSWITISNSNFEGAEWHFHDLEDAIAGLSNATLQKTETAQDRDRYPGL
jgi:hypothetical protein